MLKEGRFGMSEAVCVTIIACTCKMLFTRTTQSMYVGNTLIIGLIISVGICAALFAATLWLLKKTGSNSLQEAFTATLGETGSSIALLSFAAVLFFSSVELISSFSIEIKWGIITTMRFSTIVMLLGISAAIIAWIGPESMSRASRLVIVLLFAILIEVVFRSKDEMDISRLYPLYGDGIARGLMVGLEKSVYFVEVLGLVLIGQAIQGQKFLKRIGIRAIIISFLACLAIILAAALVFTDSIARGAIFPNFRLMDIPSTWQFTRKVGAFYISLVLGAAVIGLGYSIYLCSNAFCRAFSIEDIRPVIPAMTFSLCAYVMAININNETIAIVHSFENQFLWVLLILPFVVSFCAAAIKRKKLS